MMWRGRQEKRRSAEEEGEVTDRRNTSRLKKKEKMQTREAQ
jgi:hypothetical protein